MQQVDQSLTPQGVGQLIGRTFESLSPELQRAARWLLQHQAALALHSMRTSAREAGVSPATMTRLAQRLGFDGFEALREPFMRHLASNAAIATPRRVARSATGGSPPAGEVESLHVARQLDNVASVRALNTPQALHEAADLLLQARSVGFLGMRVCHGVAVHIQYLHSLVATNGLLLDDRGGTLADQITRLGKDDVLVAISQAPYTRQTVEGVLLARQQQVQVVALTDSPLSPIARPALRVLLFETDSSAYFRSTLGATALGELLLATLQARGGSAAQQRLHRMQDHLRRTRAYWERGERAAATALAPPTTTGEER
jgi:DNA-binding MurR/RpiR family transcriptional regulator